MTDPAFDAPLGVAPCDADSPPALLVEFSVDVGLLLCADAMAVEANNVAAMTADIPNLDDMQNSSVVFVSNHVPRAPFLAFKRQRVTLPSAGHLERALYATTTAAAAAIVSFDPPATSRPAMESPERSGCHPAVRSVMHRCRWFQVTMYSGRRAG